MTKESIDEEIKLIRENMKRLQEIEGEGKKVSQANEAPHVASANIANVTDKVSTSGQIKIVCNTEAYKYITEHHAEFYDRFVREGFRQNGGQGVIPDGAEWYFDDPTNQSNNRNSVVIIHDPKLDMPGLADAGTAVYDAIYTRMTTRKVASHDASTTSNEGKMQALNASVDKNILNSNKNSERLQEYDMEKSLLPAEWSKQAAKDAWTWPAVDGSQGAKDYLTRMYGSIEAIQKMVSYDGDQGKMVTFIKELTAAIGAKLGATFAAGFELFDQGTTNGAMGVVIKSLLSAYRKARGVVKHTGLEDWVNSKEFKGVSQYFGKVNDWLPEKNK